MLCELFVKNLALLDDIRLSFEPGLTVISGETGAGKSLIVESLALMMGQKASPSLIREGQKEAVVEAVWDILKYPKLKEKLAEEGLDQEDEMIVRRVVTLEGRNKATLNGQTVTLSQLSEFVSLMLDNAGQHDQHLLLYADSYLSFLDAFDVKNGGVAKEAFSNAWGPYNTVKKQRDLLKEKQATLNERLDFLSFQIAEIEQASIRHENEEESLLADKARLKNLDLLRSVGEAGETLLVSGENTILKNLHELALKLEKASAHDAQLVEALHQLGEAQVALEELGRFFEKYNQTIEADPHALNHIEERLFKFHQLKKKYGSTLEAVLERLQAMKKERDELQSFDDSLAKLNEEVGVLQKKLESCAGKLTDARKKAAEKLGKKMEEELKELTMPHARFEVCLSKSPEISSEGADIVSFMFSANKGEALKPLADVASGGELSRILLSLKIVLGGLQSKVYLFDEIDSGIGGLTASVLGKKLATLAGQNQVLCITHSPQIAAYAHHHFVVEKMIENARTRTVVRFLNQSERENELARMLGGAHITDKTRAHAKEMLTRIHLINSE
ncbi:MAG TPA: DNA repair protein RecN [Deltaproteobacteria bacterium]|nr:DNA repair protein RecN [Deltaproteobacteria bacterium]